MLQHEAGVVHHAAVSSVSHVRCVVVGDAHVGKTVLTNTLSGRPLSTAAYEMTTSPLVTHRALTLTSGTQVSFVLIDFPGSTAFNFAGASAASFDSIMGSAPAVAVCFDMRSRDSLVGAGKWLRRVQDARTAAGGNAMELTVVLLGLRAGDAAGREGAVGAADAGAAAASMGARFFEVLDTPASSITAPFEWLAQHLTIPVSS